MANAGHHPTLAAFAPGIPDFGYLTPKRYPIVVPAYPEMAGLFDHSSHKKVVKLIFIILLSGTKVVRVPVPVMVLHSVNDSPVPVILNDSEVPGVPNVENDRVPACTWST